MLTKRQREILRLIALGKTSKEIGVILQTTESAVENQRIKIRKSIGSTTLAEDVLFAVRIGLVSEYD